MAGRAHGWLLHAGVLHCRSQCWVPKVPLCPSWGQVPPALCFAVPLTARGFCCQQDTPPERLLVPVTDLQCLFSVGLKGVTLTLEHLWQQSLCWLLRCSARKVGPEALHSVREAEESWQGWEGEAEAVIFSLWSAWLVNRHFQHTGVACTWDRYIHMPVPPGVGSKWRQCSIRELIEELSLESACRTTCFLHPI